MRAAKVQASLRIRAVSPEPSLLAHTNSESRGTFRQKARSLAPLRDWACAVEICHDGMLEDTNSLDGAQLLLLFDFNVLKMSKGLHSTKLQFRLSLKFPWWKSKFTFCRLLRSILLILELVPVLDCIATGVSQYILYCQCACNTQPYWHVRSLVTSSACPWAMATFCLFISPPIPKHLAATL